MLQLLVSSVQSTAGAGDVGLRDESIPFALCVLQTLGPEPFGGSNDDRQQKSIQHVSHIYISTCINVYRYVHKIAMYIYIVYSIYIYYIIYILYI